MTKFGHGNAFQSKTKDFDGDVFNLTQSFFITTDDEFHQLPITLPMPVMESDFIQANLSIYFENKTPEVENHLGIRVLIHCNKG